MRAGREMRTRVVLLAEYRLCPFDEPSDRSNPNACRPATLAAKERAHFCQNCVGQVESHLDWPESEHAEGNTGSNPAGVGQIPQSLRDGFASGFHRTIGHQDMDRLVGIPSIEPRMERQE